MGFEDEGSTLRRAVLLCWWLALNLDWDCINILTDYNRVVKPASIRSPTWSYSVVRNVHCWWSVRQKALVGQPPGNRNSTTTLPQLDRRPSQHPLNSFQNHLKTASTPFEMEIKNWRRATKFRLVRIGSARDIIKFRILRASTDYRCVTIRITLYCLLEFEESGIVIWFLWKRKPEEPGGDQSRDVPTHLTFFFISYRCLRGKFLISVHRHEFSLFCLISPSKMTSQSQR
jgi:hypothetical protein